MPRFSHVMAERSLRKMAGRKPGVIALFDVDGTLTAPRKVLENIHQAALFFISLHRGFFFFLSFFFVFGLVGFIYRDRNNSSRDWKIICGTIHCNTYFRNRSGISNS